MMPKVSIIVTAFLEQSRPYLDLCMKSIHNLDWPADRLEVIVVTPRWYKPPVYLAESDRVTLVHPNKAEYYNAHALNVGAEYADKESQYILFCNDDVIFTKNSLKNLVISSQSIGDRGIFMPIGNDQQNKYMWPVPHVAVGPYRLDQFSAHAEDMLMNAESQYAGGMMFSETLCLYAVLVPRPVWVLVGEYDDSRSGQDDIDWSRRVAKAGLVNAICMNSLVYHSMGPSTSITLGPLSSEERRKSLESYNEKWSRE